MKKTSVFDTNIKSGRVNRLGLTNSYIVQDSILPHKNLLAVDNVDTS